MTETITLQALTKVDPCPIALQFLRTADIPLSPQERSRLQRKLYPIFKNSSDPELTAHRLRFITERAVQKYAAEAARKAGAVAGATALQNEPDLLRTGKILTSLQEAISDTADNTTGRQQRRACIHAALAAHQAAKTVQALRETTTNQLTEVPAQAAYTLLHWRNAVGSTLTPEIILTVQELLNPKPSH